jgi:purine-binding chemotaxis protein CheW
MSVKPVEYLQAQSFAPASVQPAKDLTGPEQAFVRKYVGADAARALEAECLVPEQEVPLPGQTPGTFSAMRTARDGDDETPLLERLKKAQTIQMVAFYLDSQVYLLPTMAVSEVLRYKTPVLLPMAPDYVAGVINLRGKVTPLLYLENLLTAPRAVQSENRFIIICSYKGLQVGLLFDKVHTMYTFNQDQLLWDVEARIGASAEFICALVDVNESIMGVISVDMIIDKVLQD